MKKSKSRTAAASGIEQTGVASTQQSQITRPRRNTKTLTILKALEHGSLNRFEAERLGDHCLNSTVSKLRQMGYPVLGVWENVPTRFDTTVRVLRYRVPRGEAGKHVGRTS